MTFRKRRSSPLPSAARPEPMRGTQAGRAALLVAFLGAVLGVSAVAAPGDSRLKRTDAEWSHDGLQRAQVPGLDLVYARVGATLAAYDSVFLRGIDVAFRRDWRQAAQPGSRIVTADVTRIKDGLARILRTELGRELGRGGYQLVEAPGAGVLELDVSIVDLYLNAPDVQGALPVRRYTMSVGEMTLQAELRDAPTGEVIARVLDRREGRDRGVLELTTAVENAAAAREAARAWAGILRRQLDAAKGIGRRP